MNINEINIKTNGFVDEFRKAQANLQANIAAGRGATFAYTGAPGTSPLPIFLRVLQRVARRAGGRSDEVHRHQLDQRDVPRIPGGDEPESVRVRVDNTTTGLIGNARSGTTRLRPAFRPTSSSRIRTSWSGHRNGRVQRRQPDDERRRHPRATRCRSNSASACRRASRSSASYTWAKAWHAAALSASRNRWRTFDRPDRSATCSTR